ncbi:MAG: hypothetical protein IPP67_06790 [Rhodospirillaceae bacterium]|nr:hypothetical protein [Rhodospirillaceae bacterium]
MIDENNISYKKNGKIHSLVISKEKILEWQNLDEKSRPLALGGSILVGLATFVVFIILMYAITGDSYGRNGREMKSLQSLFFIFGLPTIIFLTIKSYNLLIKHLSGRQKEIDLEQIYKQQIEANSLGFYNPTIEEIK